MHYLSAEDYGIRPKQFLPQKGQRIEVSNDKKLWEKRIMFEFNERNIASYECVTHENEYSFTAGCSFKTENFKYAREETKGTESKVDFKYYPIKQEHFDELILKLGMFYAKGKFIKGTETFHIIANGNGANPGKHEFFIKNNKITHVGPSFQIDENSIFGLIKSQGYFLEF